MKNLNKTLGKRLNAVEVGEFLGLDPDTVRRHFQTLGGIRLGRRILFFENLIVEAIRENRHALQAQTEKSDGMGCGCNEERETIFQGISYEKRSPFMGSEDTKHTRRGLEDPFGVLEAD